MDDQTSAPHRTDADLLFEDFAGVIGTARSRLP
jgi:hypothetical protein